MEIRSSFTSPSPHENSRPLTEEELNGLLKAHKEQHGEFYDKNILPLIQQQQENVNKMRELTNKRVELVNKRDDLVNKRDDLSNKKDELVKRSEELNKQEGFLDKTIVSLDKKIETLAKQGEESDKRIAEGTAMQMEAEKKLQEIAQKRLDALTQQFIGIFDKTPLSADETKAQFNKYLAGNNSLTVEKSRDGSYAKINSMGAVFNYLKDHPNIKSLDFRSFKTAVDDISTLATYLKTSTTVIGVAFKDAISKDAKKDLDEAVAARDGKLKVKYFP